MKMVQTIDKTTSHNPLFFEDHLTAWKNGVEVSKQIFADQLDEPKK